MRRTAIVVALALLFGAEAYAQEPGRGYLQGIGGLTFGTEPSQIFGGGLGLSLGRHVHAVFDVGRINDVVPASVRRDIDEGMRQLSAEEGVSASASLKVPATCWTGGIRILAPSAGRITPFVTLTAGVARLDPRLSLNIEGLQVSVSDQMAEDAGLTAGTEPLIGVGGGVEVAVARRLGVVLGYQFNRIFTVDPAVNTQRAFTGLTLKF